jgi:uncharacterized protein YoaH (UPF0181 family)
VIQEKLGVVLAEAANLHRANEELADRLVEVTHLRDESTNWARGGAAMVRINCNRCVALRRAVEAAIELVQLTGSDLREQALDLPTRIREVMAHDIHHGAAVAHAATHLRLQSEVDLHAMEPGFPSRMEVPEDVDVRWLLADFGVTANAIAAVVNVEQVIKDTPR